jgi:hypothetical protein
MSQSLRQPEPLEKNSTSAAPKVWFAEVPDENRVSPRVVFASADDEPVLECDEFERNATRVARFRTCGSLVSSLLLHAGLLSVLGLLVTVVQPHIEEIVLTDPIHAVLADEEVFEIDPVGAKLEAQLPAAPSALDRVPQLPETFTPEDLQRKVFSDRFEATFAPGKKPEYKILITPAEGKKHRYPKPGNGFAVTAGSFTVWTEPADPLPNQPYFIVFQIRVPSKLEKYPKSDLKIDVWGTDRFHLMIPDPRHDFALVGDLDVIEGEVQLVLPIPGAPALVKDLIQVESLKILQERQQLLITF